MKERHMRSYYIIVKSEVIFVIGSVNSHMWDRISVPALCACARQNACAVMNLKKNVLKRCGKGKIIIANHFYVSCRRVFS